MLFERQSSNDLVECTIQPVKRRIKVWSYDETSHNQHQNVMIFYYVVYKTSLASKVFSPFITGKIIRACARSVLYVIETWAVKEDDLHDDGMMDVRCDTKE